MGGRLASAGIPDCHRPRPETNHAALERMRVRVRVKVQWGLDTMGQHGGVVRQRRHQIQMQASMGLLAHLERQIVFLGIRHI